jgi:hypothetical protein
MSILQKKTVFIEKPPVTSSNCYETMKNAAILMKLGTNVNYTIANRLLNRKFSVTMATGDVSKLPKNTILHFCLFPSKLILKCSNFL